MAELIKKTELVEAMTLSHTAHANNSREASLLNRDLRIVMEQPTVTEAEIRNKAIDEFTKEIEAEYDNDACPNVDDYLDYKISLRDLFRIAEQLKGE